MIQRRMCTRLAATAFILLIAGFTPGAGQASPFRAADGVALDAENHPHYATFSICAIDPASGEVGVAVTTRVPFVGRAVPWVRAGVGAVATQAWTVVEYGLRGLDLMAAGRTPEEALERLLAEDRGRERRQLGLIDMEGRTATFTGSETGEWAGSRSGISYVIQGNILVGPEVVDAVAESFEASDGRGMPLAERLILALEAGQRRGGDRRWGLFQSAAIRIADPRDPGRGGDHISLSIDVGEHEEPVSEMKRIYYRTARRLGYRHFSDVRGDDVVELKRMLHALGYWRPELAVFPSAPRFEADRTLLTTDPPRYQELIEEYRRHAAGYEALFARYDEEAVDAVDAFRRATELNFEGNPRGLVDARLIETLREHYYAQRRAADPSP
jgi:uncharacterized Ntn-hydrolase superfamily protein